MQKPQKPKKNHISPKNNRKTVRKIYYVITVHINDICPVIMG